MLILTGADGFIFGDTIYHVDPGSPVPSWIGNIPENPGYVFAGWSPNAPQTVNENITFVAKWEALPPTEPIDPDEPGA